MSGGVVIVGALYKDRDGKRYSVFDLCLDANERRCVVFSELVSAELQAMPLRVMPIDEWCAEADGEPRFKLVEGG